MRQGSGTTSNLDRLAPPNVMLSLGLLFFFLLFTTAKAYSQYELFDIGSVVQDVKTRYNLSRTDVLRIRPMIERENEDVIVMYTRFEGSTAGYSAILWREVIRRRSDFETRLDVNLTARGRTAIRAARTEMEERLFGVLVDEYIYFLDESLELNPFQFAIVDDLFKKEYRIKHRLIVKYINDAASLERELDSANSSTNAEMERILLPSQLRYYRALLSPGSSLMG